MRAFARQMTERMKAVAAAGAVAAFWLAVWAFAAALVAQPLILPGPGAVVVALLRLVCDANTWAILVGSGARILGGLALAAICGGVLAGVSVRSRTFACLVAPALSFVKATPVACVVVLLLIWLGSARVSIAAVFLMALPGVYFSLVEGLTQADKPLEQMFRLHGVRGWRLFCAHTWREVLPFVLSCARAVIGMSWKAGVAAELIGMATGTVGERIYQAKLLIETADLLAWTVLVVAASWACERVLVWLLRASGSVAWRVAVRAHGHGLRGRAGAASDGAAAELALAVGDRAPWAPALDGLVLNVPAGGRICVMGASGAGKSTLLALAAGECAPCSMVFQDVRLAEDASALDNVLVCADARGRLECRSPVAPAGAGGRCTCSCGRALGRAAPSRRDCPSPAVPRRRGDSGRALYRSRYRCARRMRRSRARLARRSHAVACRARCRRRSGPQYLGHHHALNANSATK